MIVKGKLVIIGGAENKGESAANHDEHYDDFLKNGILARVIKESRAGKNSRIEIVTTASGVPEEIGNDYLKAFRKLEAENCGVLHIKTREEAAKPDVMKKIGKCDILFFTGGNQMRLTSVLGGTPFYDAMLEKLKTDSKFIYAGTSAGAAAASESMIASGKGADSFQKGEVTTTTGFGLIENVVFDTHFIQRGRIGRLLQLIATNPKILGIGLEDNAGLLITNNNTKMEAIGPGPTVVVNGRTIINSNLLEIRDGAPISIENLTFHVMSKTDVYDLKEHKLTIMTSEEFLK